MEQIDVVRLFSLREEGIPLFDVRSPKEFAEGHILGAESFPLFDDEERAEVGTLYKQKGREHAVERGLELVGPRMALMVRQARRLAPKGSLIVYCWRGGMRSGSVAWLLEQAGFRVYRLEGGYKAYRRWLDYTISQYKGQLILLDGKTGSGKTLLLKELQAKGEQVIDLEALAHHRGSAYGALGQLAQPTTEQFTNELCEALRRLSPQGERIWVENESKLIGHVFIPESFWHLMKSAPILSIEVPIERRIERIVADYGGFSKEELRRATDQIKKRLGGKAHQEALEAIEEGDLKRAVALLLGYYDKAYRLSTEKYKMGERYEIAFENEHYGDMAQRIIEWKNKLLSR